MKKYCLIENGKIKIEPTLLPKNWINVSNFHALDDETLKIYGWLPVETISENKEIFSSSSLEIFDDKVVETIITRDKTEEEIFLERQKQENIQWQIIREKRNNLLKESDILVLIDKWESYTEEQKQKIKTYRQELRDLPSNIEDPFVVTFPILNL
jgi:hypothetical protein